MLSNRVVAQHLAKTFSGPAIAPHRAAWALLKHADFRRVWFAGGLFGTIRWLEMLSVGVYTFDRTGSPLLVSAMMVARMLPMILFGSVFGAYAERFERRRLLLTGLSLMVVLSIVMAGLGQWIEYPLWLLAIAMFASGTFFATDFPVRRTILAEIAGVNRIGNAMAIDSATNNATRMVGPALGGIVYQSLGLKGAYALAAIVLSVCLLLVLTVRFRSKPSLQLSTSVFANIVEGFRYIKGQPRLVGALVITMIVNFWGFPFATMVPVIGRDELSLSASLVGLLAAGEGAGAFAGALLAAGLARARYYMRMYVAGSFLFVAAVLVFSFTETFGLAWAVIFVGGFGVAGFATMQTTIIYTAAAPEYRARAMGALAVSIGAGPIGVFHVGLMAEWLGASNAIGVMAVEGLIALAVATFYWKELRKMS